MNGILCHKDLRFVLVFANEISSSPERETEPISAISESAVCEIGISFRNILRSNPWITILTRDDLRTILEEVIQLIDYIEYLN